MSENPPTDRDDDPTAGDDLTAAEYALGVLDKDAREAAEARSDADPAFGEEIVRWIIRLSPLVEDAPPIEPSAELWPRIETAVGRPKLRLAPPAPTFGAPPEASNDSAPHGAALWRVWALTASAIAAAALLFVAVRPISPFGSHSGGPATQASDGVTARTLMATLSLTETKASAFTVAYDPGRSMLYATPAGDFSIPQQRSAELWLIPKDGKPRPMGLVDPSKPASMPMPPQFKALAKEEVTLALSIEPEGGSKTGLPTGPVIATGQLAAV